MKRKLQRVSYLIIVVSLLSACSGSSNTARQSTLDAISASVRETATFQAAGQQDPQAAVETAQAAATASGLSALATQAALGGLGQEANAATESAAAPIQAELPKYGVDPNAGRVGWIHPPVTLDVSGYMSYDYVNHFIATVAQDFVVSGDIYWDTQYGTSGCGFVLRSDGNKNALNQYMAILTRGASGHLLFAIMKDGDVVTGRDIYAYGKDPNFVWGNKVTNRLTVVGRGSKFDIYTNDTLIGQIDASAPPSLPGLPDPPKKPPAGADAGVLNDYQIKMSQYNETVDQIKRDYAARQREAQNSNLVFERGFIALVVLSESGHSICEFKNTWLWLIE
jgi:hypothetical protein